MFTRYTRPFKAMGALLALSWLVGCGQTPVSTTVSQGQPEITWLAPPAPAESYRPGQVVVKMKDGYSTQAITGMQRIQSISGMASTGVYATQEGESVQDAIQRLKGTPGVEIAEPNYIYRALATTNDPMMSQLWGHTKVGAQAAWDQSQGNDVLVAVIDTGVDYNHPDLQGRVIKGPDLANNDSDPMDDQGHGTHVAGTIAATANNSTGIAGIAYNSKILAIKVLGGDGSGDTSKIANGILKAAEMGAKVINLSLGGPQSSSVLKSAVDKATQQGALVVVASGNENTQTPSYPAAYPNALSVGSTTTSDSRSSFSNYGSTVDIAAPGSDILSTTEKTYKKHSGTSMASPHVAAGAAVLLGKNSALTNTQLREILSTSGDAATGFSNSSVKRMNLVKALAAVAGGSTPAPNPSDSQSPTVPSGMKALAASSTQVQLSWNASTDNLSVTGYRVFRNGEPIGTTSGTTYADSGLTAGTAYSYTVAAFDGAGNVSGQSAPANITTPSAATELTISDVYLKSLTGNSATIAWSTSVPASGQVDYTSSNYYYYGYWWTTRHSGMSADHAVSLNGLQPGTVYYLKLSSTDASGKKVTAGLYGIKTLR
jgi:thermitase